jgi:hypothetical protein
MTSFVPEISEDPLDGLNLLGDDNITFTGTNFPHEIEGNTFDLTFDSHENAKCTVVDTSSTELVCLTSQFNTNFDVGKDLTITIVVNGLTIA